MRDEENSVEGEWRGWCSRMGIEGIEIYSSNRLVWSLSASEFESSEAFVPQTHTNNETGEVHRDGWFDQDQLGVTSYWNSGSFFYFKPQLEVG